MVVNRYLNEYLFSGKASPPTDMRRGTQQPCCGGFCVPRLQHFAFAPFSALVAAFMGVNQSVYHQTLTTAPHHRAGGVSIAVYVGELGHELFSLVETDFQNGCKGTAFFAESAILFRQ